MEPVTSSDDPVGAPAGSAEFDTGARATADSGEEPWPPLEWRQADRGLGRKQAAYVFGAMFGAVVLLVLIAIWASSNG